MGYRDSRITNPSTSINLRIKKIDARDVLAFELWIGVAVIGIGDSWSYGLGISKLGI